MRNILTEDELGNNNFNHEEPQTVRGDKHCQETVLDKSDFADLETLNECPLTFQNYIEKSYEVRESE